ncbi:MAG: hypothetical protein HY403_02685 [Elusimicrobia bacterium]|nr:hypothetical protein [Elusimicrobiota bacterium]
MNVKQKPSYKRQQYWVDAPLQLQMVGFVVLLIAASLLLTAFSVFRGIQEASVASRQIFHSVEWIKGALRAPLLLASAISLLAGGLLTLFWSHRFAGPLRVISAGIARMRHGNFAVPIRVRTTDTHQEFVREFQLMQEELRKMISADRAHIAEAVSLLEAAGKRTSSDEIAKAIDHLSLACAKYHL